MRIKATARVDHKPQPPPVQENQPLAERVRVNLGQRIVAERSPGTGGAASRPFEPLVAISAS